MKLSISSESPPYSHQPPLVSSKLGGIASMAMQNPKDNKKSPLSPPPHRATESCPVSSSTLSHFPLISEQRIMVLRSSSSAIVHALQACSQHRLRVVRWRSWGMHAPKI